MDRRSFLYCAAAAGSLALPARWPLARDAARTGLVTDDIFLQPVFSGTHPEQPQRVTETLAALERAGLSRSLARLPIRKAGDDELRLVHTDAHIAGIRRNHGDAIERIGRAGVGAALAACDAVHAGRVGNAFVLSRPPGHHAANDGEIVGFCIYNNVAVAARYLQRRLGYRKILIVDWDFHHGDGTEQLFYDDPTILVFSTHRWESYPRTGDPARRGTGAGEGYNVNVPLDCGATDADIVRAFDAQLMQRAQAFRPDVILISAGFDSREQDKLGCFSITDAGYAALTQRVMSIARAAGHGRIVSVLEGGYLFEGMASGVAAHVGVLAGRADGTAR